MFRTRLDFKLIKSTKLFRNTLKIRCNSNRCLQTDQNDHFYITTPIFYVNSSELIPIGNRRF